MNETRWEKRNLEGFPHLTVIRNRDDGTVVATANNKVADQIAELPDLLREARTLLHHLQEGRPQSQESAARLRDIISRMTSRS